jgi:hypothetical protein
VRVRFIDNTTTRLLEYLNTHAELIRREPHTAATLEKLEKRCLDDARRPTHRMARMHLRLVQSGPR